MIGCVPLGTGNEARMCALTRSFPCCPRGPSHPGEALQSAYRKYTDYKGSKTAFIPIWHDYTHRKIEGIYQRQKKKKKE